MSLAQLVEDIQEVFQPIARDKNLSFEITIAPECPATIDTDVQRLEQVLKNLLSNAFKFTEKGKVELTIRRSGNGQVALSVTDTGIGISEDQQQGVFEAFRQADGTIAANMAEQASAFRYHASFVRLLRRFACLKSSQGLGAAHSRFKFQNHTTRPRWRRATHERTFWS